MEIFDETKNGLKDIWDDHALRQNAKIVITTAIGNATNLSVKDATNIMAELDILLKPDDEEDNTPNQGL